MINKFIACQSVSYTRVANDGDVCVQRDGDLLKIFFEWSNGVEDWKNNLSFPAKPYRGMKDRWFCHGGFLKVWKSIEPHLAKQIADPTVKKIEIVGYSHGGALAQLCYEYVRFNRPFVYVTGYGFGAPRVFWGPASKAVKRRFNGFVVVRNGRDIVTHLPPAIFGFRHMGTVLKIGKSKGQIKDHYPERYTEALASLETKEAQHGSN